MGYLGCLQACPFVNGIEWIFGTGECVCTNCHLIWFDPLQLFEETLVSVKEDTDIPMAFGPPRHCFSTDTQHSQHMYKLS